MRLESIKAILDSIAQTDIEELRWEGDGIKIHFRREESSVPLGSSGEPAEEKKPEPAKNPVIVSMMVGTFYRSLTPESPPLISEGSQVSVGQKVGIVEALKIQKEIVSPHAGKVVKALTENGQPVEYGQPLFEVSPPGKKDV